MRLKPFGRDLRLDLRKRGGVPQRPITFNLENVPDIDFVK